MNDTWDPGEIIPLLGSLITSALTLDTAAITSHPDGSADVPDLDPGSEAPAASVPTTTPRPRRAVQAGTSVSM